jgi:hypothetical protein
MVDERYYFSSLAAAEEFYIGGWKERQYLDDDDQPCGLDHAAFYSGGRLIDGLSIYGDATGNEGEGLRGILEKYTESLDDDVE